jgi:predicted ATPase/signal transduction histidine kinase/FixJ family two-component response regulator
MLNLINYTITEKIYENLQTIVYRGYRNHDNCPVIIKSLVPYPDVKKVAQLHHEYELTKDLNLKGITKAYELQQCNNSWVLVTENIDGDSLKNILAQVQADQPSHLADLPFLPLTTFLSLAIQLADILGELHAQRIIHKDIKPANIVINLTANLVKLIDFSISSYLPFEDQLISSPQLLEGTLIYMSPEQTGRMNRSLDYRTDFYSLGMVFYEMLVGHPPFQSADPMELVYCHLAVLPPTPHLLRAAIPPAISAIIMKLIAKVAENRYQSAYGLKFDLITCLEQLQTTETIADNFICGQQDISEQFQIAQKLYGREAEIETLLATFEQVSPATMPLAFNSHSPLPTTETSGVAMLLVSGYSGIGKTKLVQEIYKPLTPQRGYFIWGKFEQLQRNIPYGAFGAAFAELVRQLLVESESQISQWREKLLKTLGNKGQVIIEVIPEMELIIGKQPPLPVLIPAEAQNRFNTVFLSFIQVFCQPEHPLVIFLDDLQWADAASLKLIELIMTHQQIHHLLLVGAYRDNEVFPTHPLMITLNRLRNQGSPLTEIVLAPLTLSQLTQLITDTLHREPTMVTELAKLVMTKTQGNPFFVNQFLNTLYQEKWLYFVSPQFATTSTWGWQWDINHIAAQDITDNVVDLMVRKLQKLPVKTQQVLLLAACIGNHFDLKTLATVYENSIKQTYQDLLPALQAGLVLSLSGLEAVAGADPETSIQFVIVNYKFLHDRVQQAAYTLIDEAQKQAVHLQIGRLLLSQLVVVPEQLTERLFEVVDHLNVGLALVTRFTEQIELIQLNLTAAQKAKKSLAYSAAQQYLLAAFRLLTEKQLEEQLWQQYYDLALQLYRERAEVEYLNNQFEQSEAIIHQTIARVNTALEKADLYHMLIMQYTLRAKYAEAIQTGQQALTWVGIELPLIDLEAARDRELIAVKAQIGNRAIADLFQLPLMTDPDKQMAVKLLITMGPPCYRSHQRLWAVIVPKVVNLCLEYGNVPQVGYSHTALGGLVGYVWNDYTLCEQLGQLAYRLMTETFLNPSDQSVFYLMIGSSVRHWSKHLKYATQDYQEAYRIGLESGNLQYAAYAFGHNMYCRFYQGTPLDELLLEIENSLNFSRQRQNQWAIDLLEGGQRLILYLQGVRELTSDEEPYLQQCEQHKNIQTLCIYFILKTQVLYLLGDIEAAWHCYEEAEQRLIAVATQGLLPTAEHCCNHSLILTALYTKVSATQQTHYWQQLQRNQQQMQIWADHCPENFLHHYFLVAAEMARLSGQALTATDWYDYAIGAANTNQFVHNVALANELAAHFWLSRGKEKIAFLYLTESHYRYRQWGAIRKVRDLEQRYPRLLNQLTLIPHVTDTGVITISQTTRTSGKILDLSTIIKASQTLSSEIIPEQLIEKLMHIVMENAGAERSWLILKWPTFSRSNSSENNSLTAEPASLGNEAVATPATSQSESTADSGSQWFVYAYGQVVIHPIAKTSGIQVQVLTPIPLESLSSHKNKLPSLSTTIINYVLHTQTPIRLNDATQEGLFTQDPQVIAQQIKSVLCIPVIKQNQIIGLIYLENNLTSGAFTPNCLKVLRLLSTQIAISLENAFFYAQLEQARQAAESANRAKSTFLANMSHELRTPLNAILGYTQILWHNNNLDATWQEGIQVIHRSGEYLLTLINDVLDLSKIEAGLMELNPTAFHFGRFLSEIAKSFQLRARQKGISFNYYCHASLTDFGLSVEDSSNNISLTKTLPVMVYADEKRLRQILINLLSNAIKFTHHGNVNFKVGFNQAKIRFQVEDTGVGIAAEELSQIFSPFQQAGNPKYRAPGSGLGLSLCQKLLEMMGEQLHVNSIVGQGSQFWLELLLPEVTPNLTVTTGSPANIVGFQYPHSQDGSRNCKILIVDDRAENRLVLANFLTPVGFEVKQASHGQEALEKMTEWHPDLILMDLVMPVMNGFEAIRQIRQNPQLTNVIIIAMSSSLMSYNQVEELKAIGCGDFMTKPIQNQLLLDCLQKHLQLTWIYQSDFPDSQNNSSANQTLPVAAAVTSLDPNHLIEMEVPIKGPSAQQAATLFELAKRGDIHGILNQLEQFEQADEQLAPFAEKIRYLAKNFQRKQIRDLVKPYLN